MRSVVACIALSGMGITGLLAQTAPAPVLQIIREVNKEGRSAAHEKIETEWAAAAKKANHPANYVGFASLAGPDEFWFIEPMASFAMFEDWDKANNKEPYKTMSADLSARDGEVRASSRTIWMVYRPDLSYGAERFNPGKAKFVSVGMARIRIGKDEDFAAGGKVFLDAWRKANVHACVLTYQSVAGAPDGTFYFFDVMESMKEMDGYMARMQAVAQAMGQENFSRFMKSGGDVFATQDSTILQVKPAMSYPAKDMVDANPEFWKPKAAMPAPAKKAAQP